jgi:hypothetical protein
MIYDRLRGFLFMAKKLGGKSTISDLIAELSTPDPFDTSSQEAAPIAVAPVAPATPANSAKNPSPKLVVPEAVSGIQINFCKNPVCPNFSMPAGGARNKQGGWQGGPAGGTKKRAAAPVRYKPSGGDDPYIQCQSCGECPQVKSNLGIKEEVERLSAYLEKP